MSGYNSCFVFKESCVQISTRRLAILIGFLWFNSDSPGKYWDGIVN
jgi:hypothetical protein